jgi:hypothetical protein
MTTTARAFDTTGLASGGELRIVDALDFQFAPADQCSGSVVREISNFVDAQDTSHPFQLPQWEGTGAYFATLRRQGEIRWFALCGVFFPAGRYLRQIRALVINRGPVCDDTELRDSGLQHLIEQSRLRGFGCIDIAPEWTGDVGAAASAMLAETGWQSQASARSSLRLDLGQTSDRLLGSFRKATRYEIRRSEREEVEIRMTDADRDEREEWLRMYLDMAQEKQFEADQAGHTRQVLDWLAGEPQRGGLFLAKKNGKMLGGILVIRCAARCWYLLGATCKDSKFSVGHLLQWKAIQWAREHQCREYDFGGYQEAATTGPAFFKSGFGGRVVHFPPSHRYVLSPWQMRVCSLMAKVRTRLLYR